MQHLAAFPFRKKFGELIIPQQLAPTWTPKKLSHPFFNASQKKPGESA
jgi:hypothetical protein